jgi:predicted dehydrogenase
VSNVAGSSSGRLKVGVVGSGIIAATHVPYIRKAGGEVVGVADVSMAQANDLADRFAIQRVYHSVSDLLDAESPDVVHVVTPPHTHAELAVTALERGVHVLVEKPMALLPSEVESMMAAASRGGALLTVDHNRLFDPVMLEARRLMDSGEIGELVAVESYQAGLASDRAWLSTLPGGGIGDLIPHPLYLQLAFLGPVGAIHVAAFGGRDADNPAELRVLMEGENASGMLTISTGAKPHLNTLKLCGSRMTVEVNLNNMTIVKRRDYSAPKVIAKSLPNLDEAWTLFRQTAGNTVNFVRGKIRYYPGMGNLISRFYDGIRAGGEPPVTAEQGAEVVRVTSRIWQELAAKSSPQQPTGATAGAED